MTLCSLRSDAEDEHSSGIIFVASAGNESSNTDAIDHYPSGYRLPNILSIAASDPDDDVADFSQWGPFTAELAAPGVNITTTDPFNGSRLETVDGTSFSSPYVAMNAAYRVVKENYDFNNEGGGPSHYTYDDEGKLAQNWRD